MVRAAASRTARPGPLRNASTFVHTCRTLGSIGMPVMTFVTRTGAVVTSVQPLYRWGITISIICHVVLCVGMGIGQDLTEMTWRSAAAPVVRVAWHQQDIVPLQM